MTASELIVSGASLSFSSKMSSAKEIIEVSGVRSSCDMVEMNCVFATSSACSRAFCSASLACASSAASRAASSAASNRSRCSASAVRSVASATPHRLPR